MPKLAERTFFGGAENKLDRLGLKGAWGELENVLTDFKLRPNEFENRNPGAVLRKRFDDRFRLLGGWNRKQLVGVDWIRCHTVNDTRVCLGVRMQFSVSAQSDLLLIDLQYLYDEIIAGRIDIGVIVVASPELAHLLSEVSRRTMMRSKA